MRPEEIKSDFAANHLSTPSNGTDPRDDPRLRKDKSYKLPCCRRKRNHSATAPRARQGVNLTCGDGHRARFINLRAGGAIARPPQRVVDVSFVRTSE